MTALDYFLQFNTLRGQWVWKKWSYIFNVSNLTNILCHVNNVAIKVNVITRKKNNISFAERFQKFVVLSLTYVVW